ncbi:MAG: hypothetical protein V1899_03050 [Planctomycetota bacterium]
MATGRIREQDRRFYVDGVDLSGHTRKTGDLKWEHVVPVDAAWTDAVKAAIAIGQASLGIGTFNGFFDNTATSGLHTVMNGAGVKRVVMIPQGVRGAPAQGDPVYCGEFEQLDYKAQVDNNIIVASIPFGEVDAIAAAINYTKPWGKLLHAKGNETAVNSAIGIDDVAQSTAGGFMCWQIFSVTGTGSVTLTVQDAATNTDVSFANVSGLTSGAIAHTAVPSAGIIALATTATIRQFTRWQISFSTITGCNFALAFIRG